MVIYVCKNFHEEIFKIYDKWRGREMLPFEFRPLKPDFTSQLELKLKKSVFDFTVRRNVIFGCSEC